MLYLFVTKLLAKTNIDIPKKYAKGSNVLHSCWNEADVCSVRRTEAISKLSPGRLWLIFNPRQEISKILIHMLWNSVNRICPESVTKISAKNCATYIGTYFEENSILTLTLNLYRLCWSADVLLRSHWPTSFDPSGVQPFVSCLWKKLRELHHGWGLMSIKYNNIVVYYSVYIEGKTPTCCFLVVFGPATALSCTLTRTVTVGPPFRFSR